MFLRSRRKRRGRLSEEGGGGGVVAVVGLSLGIVWIEMKITTSYTHFYMNNSILFIEFYDLKKLY